MAASAQRTAVNALVQSSGADALKLAMIRLHHARPAGCAIVMTLHDEIIVEAPEGAAAAAAASALRAAMEGALELRVPLPVRVRAGPNWADLVQ